MRKSNKKHTTLPINTTTIHESTQTPIEIALKIDENGINRKINIFDELAAKVEKDLEK